MTPKRSVLATVGPAITMIGLLCVVAGSQSDRSPMVVQLGQIFIAGGFVLLIVMMWQNYRRR